MQIGFILEAGEGFGLGHYMRSRILAYQLSALGCNCDLILRGNREVTQRWPGPWQNIWHIGRHESLSIATECVMTNMRGRQWCWLVVDGYQWADAGIVTKIRLAGGRSVQFDDFGAGSPDAELVINTGAPNKQAAGRLLAGPQFAPVDGIYAEIGKLRRYRDQCEQVLVAFGGGDCMAWTPRIIPLLDSFPGGLTINVVAGPFYASGQSFTSRHSICIHHSPTSLAGLMENADLYVGAAGSTVWEACAAHLPMVLVKTVENQDAVFRRVSEVGAALGVDAKQTVGISSKLSVMLESACRQDNRIRMGQAASELVDGCGALRVAQSMMAVLRNSE